MKKLKMLKINFIIALVSSIPVSIIWAMNIVAENSMYIADTSEMFKLILVFYIIMFIAVFLLMNIMCLPFYIIKTFSTAKKIVNEQYIDTKKSIYTRDLPEQYNSVIAGEILDFKSRFTEEYIAGVIELISKGYIIEDEDKLVVNSEKSTDNLLKNEKYILDTCTIIDSDSYFEYSYEFFKKVREDMLDLGIYKDNNFLKKIKDRIIYTLKKQENNTSIGLFFFITFVILAFSFIYNFKLVAIMIILLYITIIVMIRKNKLTKKGEMEKEKVGKLKLFLDKETNFKDKTKEERKMWGRYSAFAVALGNNERIKEEILEKYFTKI